MDLRKDIYFYADLASFPASGAANLLYVDSATSLIYIWNGASYVASGAGGLKYGGLWNAATNNPTITSGVGDTGEYYIVGTAGTTSIDGINDWAIGDWIIFGGSAWQKIDNSDKVVSDGVTITGDGTIANPLVSTGSSSSPTIQVVLFADLATTERLNPCTYNNGTLGVGATLTGNSNGQLSTISFVGRIDNVITALNQTILVWQQVDQRQNGLYVVTQLGDGSNPFILTRSIDSDTQAEMYPLQINTYNGATLANRAFLQKTVDPVVGTNNIVFTTSAIGIQTSNLNFVDTVTSAALPSCTYTDGTNPTIPGVGARLTATANASIGTINGIALAVNNRILVKDQVNQAHNGDYSVTQVGSGSLPFILTRFSGWGGEFPRLVREWKVNNPSSTKYGARYSTNLTSLSNTNVGITAIPFFEVATPSGVFGIANTSGVYTYYDTLTLAMAAATAGQTIEMFADVTESSVTAITLKNGVNINGNGHTYNYTAATGNCFIDNGVAVSCVIQNFNITRTGHTADNILRITNQNSVIDCTGSLFKCTCVNTSNAFVVVCGGTLTNCNVFATGTNIQGINAPSFGAKGILRNSTSETTGSGAAIYGDILYSTNQEIFNCNGKSVSGIGIYGERIINSRGFSTSGTGISGTCYNSWGISTSSFGIQTTGAYNSTGISSSGIGMSGTAYNSTAISATGSARGNGTSYNCIFTTSGAPVYPTFGINPGSIYNCFLESTWNSASGHCLTFASNYAATPIDVVNSTLRVVNASANCIVSFNGAGTPINYSNNVFKGATTPIGSNITQNIVNTQDNQGNILL
jgi:hypothetical protein